MRTYQGTTMSDSSGDRQFGGRQNVVGTRRVPSAGVLSIVTTTICQGSPERRRHGTRRVPATFRTVPYANGGSFAPDHPNEPCDAKENHSSQAYGVEAVPP